ncbi:MAG: hypothetical protein Q9227_006996 [Pyrenula ochraceoflavens]
MAATNEKQPETGSLQPRPPGKSISYVGKKHQLPKGDDVVAENESSQRKVRTIPAWVRSADEDDVEWHAAQTLLHAPSSAYVAQHNHTPSSKDRSRSRHEADSYFTAAPGPAQERQSRWVTFAKSSAYPSENHESEKVSPEWLNEHLGDYSQPWLAGHDSDNGEDDNNRYRAFRRKRKVWYKRYQNHVLKDPMVPLFFRMTNIFFACAALALGSSIHHLSDRDRRPQGPSAEMAIIVDAIAIAYILYVTFDEYTARPLGLRSAKAKMRLIFLDIFFIVFQSANLALAYESFTDANGACVSAANAPDGSTGNNPWTTKDDDICRRQRGLAAVLLISLFSWLLTFAAYQLCIRVVERLVQS